MAAHPTFELNNGVVIPALGFGTFAKEGTADEGVMQAAVVSALEAGYRHLDAAWIYGNEEEVGNGIREFLSNNSNVKRDDIFVTTKVWVHLMEPEDVEWSLNDSLKKLGLDYVDCLLLHWPLAVEKESQIEEKKNPDETYAVKKELTENLEPTWKAMEKLYASGKVKVIGVSNWSIGRLNKMLKFAIIPPAINQIEIHPFFPNTELVDFCFAHKILPVAYSPLGSQLELGFDLTRETLMKSPALLALAEKKNVGLATLLISWGIKRGYAVLPKSATPARIQSNFQLVDLSEEEFAAIKKVSEGRDKRFVDPVKDWGYDVWADI